MITEKDKMEKLTHGSLFSGIGGFDLAAEWIGLENKFHCEWDDFGKKILSYYWPNAKSYGDITKTDFRQWRGGIDVLTGGFPCQPFSTAGKRLGKDDNRYLWPEMLRAIREIQPTWVIGENVGGIISMVQPCDEVKVGCQTSLLEEDYFTKKEQEYVVETVCSDLEREGYSVQPVLIPACSVGAPHRRDRVWFVAYSKSNDDRKQKGENNPEREDVGGRKTEIRTEFTRHGYNEAIAYSDRYGGGRIENEKYSTERRQQALCRTWQRNGDGVTPDTPSQGREVRQQNRGQSNSPENGTRMELWDKRPCDNGDVTHPRSPGQQKQNISTEPTEQGFNPRGNNAPGAAWQNFPTQSPVCNGDDGISTDMVRYILRTGGDCYTEEEAEQEAKRIISKVRAEGIKAGGNAIVPQVAYEIFKAIKKIEGR